MAFSFAGNFRVGRKETKMDREAGFDSGCAVVDEINGRSV